MSQRIAIVGMAGRFPGAETLDDFWRIVSQGGDAITDFSPADLRAAGVPEVEISDPRYVRSAPVLRDIAGFDAAFFGLSAEQAELLDPQHRLFFECAWEALEMAAHPPEGFGGSIGVFAGCSISSYLLFNLLPDLAPGAAPATLLAMIGNEKDYLSSHLSYLLGLTGPSIGVQTACSSSLAAVHLACQSLLQGECDLALAGGANVRVPHRVGYRYEEGSILSASGRCRSFDAAADGTVFGSGVGVVALRRLADALADGDPIQAVILGSALNNDGARKAGYTAPSVDGQAAVVAEALAVADVEASSIGYIEAHGTGTPIGDPIEIRALAEVFAGLPAGSIGLGSVKAAFGHLEAAAGVAGLMAAALAVKHRVLPPISHFCKPNPLLRLELTPFAPSSVARPWLGGGARRAGVSSFGIGGTNAHVVIEAPPPISSAGSAGSDKVRQQILCLSARDKTTLLALQRRYATVLDDDVDFSALCRTAALGRRHFDYRLALVADSPRSASHALPQAVLSRTVSNPRLAMLFSGQGSWVSAAGRSLSAWPEASRVLEQAAAIVPGIRQLLNADDDSAYASELAQPAMFALQWALVEQLRAWGITPAAVTGHSLGELAAAAAAGVFAWEDGLRFAAQRGRLMHGLPPGGGMAAVFTTLDVVRTALLEVAADQIALAAINAPDVVVIAGAEAALQGVLSRLAAQGVEHRSLQVQRAFHSPLMEPIRHALDSSAARVPVRFGQGTWVSTLTGAVVERPSATHWSRQACEPVQFSAALASLREMGCTAFLEIGPGMTLSGLARRQCGSGDFVGSTLTRAGAPQVLLQAVAALYGHGLAVDWAALLGSGPRLTAPTYPFHHQRYWREASPAGNASEIADAGELPGRDVPTPLARRLCMTRLRPDSPGWLAEHSVAGEVIIPGALHVALALTLGANCLQGFQLERPAGLGKTGLSLQTIFRHDGRVEIHTSESGDEPWQRVASGEARRRVENLGMEDLVALQSRCRQPLARETFYRHLADDGIALGAAFQRLEQILCGSDEVLGRLRPADDLPPTRLQIHPLVLDALFQSLGALLLDKGLAAHLPMALDELTLDAAADLDLAVWCHARLRPVAPGGGGLIGDLSLLDAHGRRLLRVTGLGCRPVAAPGDIGALLYAPVWRPAGVSILPEPSLLAKQIRHHVDLSDYLQYLPKSDALCSAYVAQAFQQLGAHFDFGREVVLSAAIQPAYQELLPRLWGMLEADRLIDSQHRSLQTRLPPPSSLLAEIQSSHPAQAPETALLARCGGALADVLSGALDPLTLLFGAAEQDGARRVYAEGRYALALNTLAANALDQALPSAGGLRVLEIGAGTGGTTRRILPVLKGRVREYWFTDISPGFLSAASQVFGADDFFRTALLDIERPAEDQGMKAGYFDLVIAANVMHATRDLAAAVAHAVGALAPGGWLLLIEGLNDSRWLDLTFGLTAGWRLREDRELRPRSPLLPAVVWNQLLRRHGCDDVAVLTPGSGRLSDQGVILASKGSPRPAQQTVCRAALRATDPVAAVLAELQADPDSVTQRLIATRGGQSLRPWEVPDSLQSSVWGLVRAAALECPGQRMRLVDLDPLEQNPQRTLRLEASIDDNEREVAWRDGRRYVLRLTSIEAQTPLPERFRIAPSATGLLDSLAPRPLAKSAPGAGEVEIAVAAAGLNFKDLLTVLGALSADSVTSGLGGECAGTVSAVGPDVTEFHLGERVMAWVSGSFASHVIVPLTRVIRIPPAMTLAQGAAFPVAATTVFHALDEVGHLATGQRVLIHAATGGIGTFALAWARSVGAEVLATAGAAWKREWLRRQGVQHVFDSRTPAFASQVMTATAGEGVDVALNSLTGEMVAATLGLVRAGGVFVELGRTEIWPEEQVAARFPQVSYRVVALDAVSEAEGSRLIRGAVDAFLSGKLPAPNVTAVPMARLVEALRSMQQAQHLGKIVLTIPRPYRINPDRGYLITGGLGGLGLVTAEWLVARGARHLALVSRSAPNAAAQSRIRALEAAGAKVSCLVADLSKAAEISRVGEAIRSVLPTLAGILHAAGLLDDAVLAEQTPQHFVRVAGPKLTPLADLAEMAAAADAFLVLFSSAAGLLGSAGQANHAAISSQLDALALSYRVRGIAATSIDWGAWSDIGAAAKRGVGERLSVIGMGMISPQQGIEALEAILFEQTRPIGAQIAVLPIDRAALSRHFGQSLPPLFGEILRREKDDRDLQPKKEAKETAADPFELNLAALPAGRRLEHTAKWIEAQARGLLNAGAGGMRHDRPLTEMGLDSLLAVELRNRLGALTGISLPATLLFNYPTILALAEYLLTLLLPEQTAHAEPPTRPSASDPSLEDEILSLDESDLDAILRDMEQRHLT